MALQQARPTLGRGTGSLIPKTDEEAGKHQLPVSIRYVSHLDPSTRKTLATLTPADFREFAGIRHTPTRERSLATRAALRELLSEVAAHVPPSAWAFTRDENGKPILAAGQESLHFSCSHTLWMSVVAVSRQPVGVDIESAKLSIDDAFLTEYFAPAERAAVSAKTAGERPAAYARLWTLKEAVTKMLGMGLAVQLSELEFESEDDRVSNSCRSEINNLDLQLLTWSLPNKAHPLCLALALSR